MIFLYPGRYGLFKSIVTSINRIKNFHYSTNTMALIGVTVDEIQSDLKDIFNRSVTAVLPDKLIENKIQLKLDRYLCVDDLSFLIKGNVYIIGFGKAVMPMAFALERILGDKIKEGIVSVSRGSCEKYSRCYEDDFGKSKIKFYEGASNNQPDKYSLQTTNRIIELLRPLTSNDTVIALVSGGGSALLVKPKCSITLEEKKQLCRSLQNAGADITELNTVRIALSEVKGGGLARIAYPSFVISLILSDIIGDPIDIIASGPTIYQRRTTSLAFDILNKYDLINSLPENIYDVLLKSKEIESKHDCLESDALQRLHNVIIGNNAIALKEAFCVAEEKGFKPIILSNCIQNDVRLVSQAYADLVDLVCEAMDGEMQESEFIEKCHNILDTRITLQISIIELWKAAKETGPKEMLLIAGGEPTVQVRGTGKGGRNQELALSFSVDWSEKIKQTPNRRKYHVIMLSAGTDGQDGPTDTAGAFGYPQIGSIVLYIKLKLLDVKKIVDKDTTSFIDLDAVEEFKIFQNVVLGENKNFVDKDFLEKVICYVNSMELKSVLSNNDSYSFYSKFRKGQDLLTCGVTGTNVMDLHFIYLKQKQCCCQYKIDKSNVFLEYLNLRDFVNINKNITDNKKESKL